MLCTGVLGEKDPLFKTQFGPNIMMHSVWGGLWEICTQFGAMFYDIAIPLSSYVYHSELKAIQFLTLVQMLV